MSKVSRSDFIPPPQDSTLGRTRSLSLPPTLVPVKESVRQRSNSLSEIIGKSSEEPKVDLQQHKTEIHSEKNLTISLHRLSDPNKISAPEKKGLMGILLKKTPEDATKTEVMTAALKKTMIVGFFLLSLPLFGIYTPQITKSIVRQLSNLNQGIENKRASVSHEVADDEVIGVELQTNVDKLEKQKDQLLDDWQKKKNELDGLKGLSGQEEEESLQAKKEQLSNELSELTASCKNNEDKLQEAHYKLGVFGSEHSDSAMDEVVINENDSKEIKAKKEEILSYQKEISSHRQNISSVNEEIKGLKNELEAVRGAREEIPTADKSSLNRLLMSKSSISYLIAEIQKKEEAIAYLSEEIQIYKEGIEDCKKFLENA